MNVDVDLLALADACRRLDEIRQEEEAVVALVQLCAPKNGFDRTTYQREYMRKRRRK